MSRKVFTAGEVLAAAAVNSFLMDQSVMSFAGTAARGSAIPSPVTGMTTYLEDSKRLQVYSGTSFVNASGLELINNTDFSSATVNLSNILDSTYSRYRITITAFMAVGTPALLMRFRENVTDKATNYFGGSWQIRFDAATLGTGFNGDSSITVINNIGNGATSRSVVSLDLYRAATDGIRTGTGFNGAASGAFQVSANTSGMTNFTGLTIFTSTASAMTGNIKVYGYKEAI
jgi:hypothetical protein